MSAFWRRLKYFLGGFIPGCVIVILFFQNRGCSWLPDNRVRGSILEKIILVDSTQQRLLNKAGITKNGIKTFIEGCEVDFKKSDVKKDTKVYLIKNNGRSMYVLIPKNSFIAELKSVYSKDAKKMTSKGKGDLWKTPANPDFVYIKTDGELNCKQNELGLKTNKAFYNRLRKVGRFDFGLSKFSGNENIHYFTLLDSKGRGEVGVNSVWYKEKMDIRELILPFDNECAN
ncbi:MAG: hypothetical protein ACK48V_02955 [Crocinitomicaceae bacterium]|jgi:hypothetical protein